MSHTRFPDRLPVQLFAQLASVPFREDVALTTSSNNVGRASVALFACLSGHTPEHIDEMDAADLLTALRAVATMLQQSPPPTSRGIPK